MCNIVACYWNNAHRGLRVPVYGILSDGNCFQFFLFDGNHKPYSFRRGALLGDPPAFWYGFQLQDHAKTETPGPFIHAMRQICEIIFDLLLTSYISSLKAYHDRSIRMGERQGMPRESTGEWEQALALAGDALEKFRIAETRRQNGLCTDANVLVQDVMEVLKRRYVPFDVGHASNLTTRNLI